MATFMDFDPNAIYKTTQVHFGSFKLLIFAHLLIFIFFNVNL